MNSGDSALEVKCGVEEGLRRRGFKLLILSELLLETAVVENAVVVDWLCRFVMVLPDATGLWLKQGNRDCIVAGGSLGDHSLGPDGWLSRCHS